MKHRFHSNLHVNVLRLKDCIDPIDFYTREGQEISTHGRGQWKIGGICPFHADRNTGSFYINSLSGAFRCFSCDANGGDIISFVQKKYEITFRDALEKLINEWRVA